MQIILLEKVINLGQLGDVVRVKDGYARNFLIPKGKARRATAAAVAEFEARRAELERVQADGEQGRDVEDDLVDGDRGVTVGRRDAAGGGAGGTVHGSPRAAGPFLSLSGFQSRRAGPRTGAPSATW